MGDANHSTQLGRFLNSLPIGERLKERISAGDYVLDKVVGLVDKKTQEKPKPGEFMTGRVTGFDKKQVVEKVILGADYLLDQHEFDDLTGEENDLVDQIAVLCIKLLLSIGMRKAAKKA